MWFGFVTSHVCQHPAFLIPQEKETVLLLNQHVKISCSVEKYSPENEFKNSTQHKLVNSNVSVICKNNATVCSDEKVYLSDRQKALVKKFNEGNEDLQQESTCINENNYPIRARGIISVLARARIYTLMEEPPLKYVLFNNHKDGNKYVLLQIKSFEYKNKSITFYATDHTGALVGIKDTVSSKKVHFDVLKDSSVSLQTALYQMWLECKLKNSLKGEDKFQSKNLKYVKRFYLNFNILWMTVGIVFITYFIGVLINLFTLRNLKFCRRKEDRKYFLVCLSHSLTVSTISSYFLKKTALMEQQMYEILQTLHADDRKRISMIKQENLSYKYDYARVSGYMEIKNMYHRLSERRSTQLSNTEYLSVIDIKQRKAGSDCDSEVFS